MVQRRRSRSRHCKSLKHTSEQNAPSANCSKTIDRASRPNRLITKRELCQMVPYTPQHILRLEKEGKFPRRVQVGSNRVAWLESELAWPSATPLFGDVFKSWARSYLY
jgi:prophage regulatory protein